MQVVNQREIIIEVQEMDNIKSNKNTNEFSRNTYIGITAATMLFMIILSIMFFTKM